MPVQLLPRFARECSCQRKSNSRRPRLRRGATSEVTIPVGYSRRNEGQSPRRASRPADAAPDLHLPRSLRHRPGARQAHGRHRRLQPPEALQPAERGGQAPDQEVERPADRPDRLRQDAHRPHAGRLPGRPVHRRRRDRVHRGRLLRQGRRGDGRRAAPPGRPGRRARAARHRLRRRDRQDRAPQPRRPHRRRIARHRRRGRAAGAAQAARGARDLRAAERHPALEQARLRRRSTRRTSCSSAPGRSRDLRLDGAPPSRSASARASTGGAPPSRRVTEKELLDYGLLAEFLGRLPVRVELDPLRRTTCF